ncbi:hypothetical protein INT45_010229 [Circinella minor]|uniref:Uncharacterized protein n=1 Tax=Circinella minor TaxID=1195481 RepID=A0A8H7SE64_9FUNG|nr:hypothetical protein INT45_010229 [Circinella minor]
MSNDRDGLPLYRCYRGTNSLEGTLGSNLLRLSDELTADTMRRRYFSMLSRNGIVDISDDTDGSQLHVLDDGSNTKQNIIAKIGGPNSVKECIEQLTCTSITEKRRMASIYVVTNILKQHAYKSHMLSDQYFEGMSINVSDSQCYRH